MYQHPVSRPSTDIPTSSAAVAAKNTPTPNSGGADSTTNRDVSTITVTTSITVSVTDTTTATSASVTVTIVMHDLATVATTALDRITVVQHDTATVATTVPTTVPTNIPTTVPSTILTTQLVTPSITQTAAAHTTAALPPAMQDSTIPLAKKHTEPAVVLSIVFGLTVLGLLGLICFLVMKIHRLRNAKQTSGMKSYAEEFNWPRQRPVEMSDIGRKDEWGQKQKEAWGMA